MKRISLSEEAYRRLAAWRDSARESFSAVVLKVVPTRGTLGDLGAQIDRLSPLTDEQLETMEAEVRWANDWRNQKEPSAQPSKRRS